MTLFVAFKKGIRNPNSEWWWFCPSKGAIKGFAGEISSLYFKIDETNKEIRQNLKYDINRTLIQSLVKLGDW